MRSSGGADLKTCNACSAELVSIFQADPYQRGALVRIRDVTKPAVFRIVAVPGDRIRADETGLYVNDAALAGFSRDFLTRFTWEPRTIPENHYLVMGEQRLNDEISEDASLQPASFIEHVQ
jgi:hypothetical protein